MKNIYLDNNATTRVAEEVVEEMLPYFSNLYGNASSMHSFGGNIRHKIDYARQQAAQLLNCGPEELIFTSGGTESDNTAIRSVLELNPNKRHIVTTRVEHPAVRTMARHFQRRGYRLTELPVDAYGRIDLDQLEAAISNDTALVTIMHANNETGVIFPVDKIAPLVKSKGVLFHTDAVQAVGKMPYNLADIPVDLLSLSGHKLHGPKGIGILYVRRGTPLSPLIMGGHQEFSRRAGTENTPGIVGLGKACELAQKNMEEENGRVRQMRDWLETHLLRVCPDARVNGDRESRLPNTTNISFEYVEGEAILLLLDQLGIAASSGSACTSGSLEPSHVLRAMGVPFTAVHGSIRFSLSRYNTIDEIEYVIRETPGVIKRLRQISMFSSPPDAGAPRERKPRLDRISG
ncbi:MAG: cysteine desulfurase [Phycisphaerae bacterium SM23_30]|nr:MAG: cysteine desulfurase [Phycisphaerae bacterium SM23_30]